QVHDGGGGDDDLNGRAGDDRGALTAAEVAPPLLLLHVTTLSPGADRVAVPMVLAPRAQQAGQTRLLGSMTPASTGGCFRRVASVEVGRAPAHDCGGSQRQNVGTTLMPVLEGVTLRIEGENPCEVNHVTSCRLLKVAFTLASATSGARFCRF